MGLQIRRVGLPHSISSRAVHKYGELAIPCQENHHVCRGPGILSIGTHGDFLDNNLSPQPEFAGKLAWGVMTWKEYGQGCKCWTALGLL
jgi:hypothetical protein